MFRLKSMMSPHSTLKSFITLIAIFAGLFLLSRFGLERHALWWVWGAAILSAFIFFDKNIQITSFISLLIHVIPDPLSLQLLSTLYGNTPSSVSPGVIHVLFSTSALILIVLFLRLLPRYSSFFQKAYSHYVVIFAFFLLVISFVLLPSSLFRSNILYFFILLGRFLWPLCYYIRSSLRAKSWQDSVLHTGLLAPFWSYGLYYLPIPLGPPDLLAHREYDKKKSLPRGALALGWTILLIALHNFLVVILFGRRLEVIPYFTALNNFLFSSSLNIPDIYTRFQDYGSLDIPFYYRALAIWGRDILFILELFLTFGAAIAIAKCMGFQIPRMVYRPLHSKTFIQYMGSFLHYYKQYIIKIYFEPLLYLLRRQSGFIKKVSLRLSIFVSLLIGGFLFHLLRDLSRLGGVLSAGTFLQNYLQVLPYFIAIASLAAFASRNPLPLPQPIRILFYFSIHPLVMFGIMTITRFQSNLEAYQKFIFNLLGLGGS